MYHTSYKLYKENQKLQKLKNYSRHILSNLNETNSIVIYKLTNYKTLNGPTF